jgi:hypothetical protein
MITLIAIVLVVWFFSWRQKNVREARHAARMASYDRAINYMRSNTIEGM